MVALGLSVLCAAWPMTLRPGNFWLRCDWSTIAVGILLLILGYFVGAGRNWARRILLGAVIALGLALAFRYGVRAFLKMYVTDVTPEQAEVVTISAQLEGFSRFFLVVGLGAFLVLLLRHPDVVASFRARAIPRLFVYGSLAPGRANAHVLADFPGTWKPATVVGTLVPEGWGAAAGYPGIVLGEQGATVEGLLFSSESLAEHWARLDEFEGDAYERVLTRVTLQDGSTVEAYVYALRGNSQPGVA